MGNVYTIDGWMEMDVLVEFMDDEIREEMHSHGYASEQEFYDAYCDEHRVRFCEEFIVY